MLLVFGSMLPFVVFSALLVSELLDRDKNLAKRNLERSAKNLSTSLDLEIEKTISSLKVLGQSEALLRGELDAYHKILKRVQKIQEGWLAIILHNSAGDILLNSRRSRQEPLPQTVDPESLATVLKNSHSCGGSRRESS